MSNNAAFSQPTDEHSQAPQSRASEARLPAQSRRTFLKRSGFLLATVGAAGSLEAAQAQSAAQGCPMHGQAASAGNQYRPDSFGRMFPQLPPFAADTPEVRAALLALGSFEGPMNVRLPPPPPPPGDLPPQTENDVPFPLPIDTNPKIPTGFSFVGQFIAHDLTFDAHSTLTQPHDPATVTNFRTPALDLDSMYGAGPVASAHLYDKGSGNTKFLIDMDAPWDLPRNEQQVAIISDPRGDQTVIAAQMFQAFLRFHNAVVEALQQQVVAPLELFNQAQRLVRWHYQWLIVHEYLPLIAGQDLVEELLDQRRGRRFFKWQHAPFMPVEFAAAAFRFGHSQTRPTYVVNRRFAASLFAVPTPNNPNPEDLSGGKRDPRMIMHWPNFFNLSVDPPGPSMLIDTRLPSTLFRLPFKESESPNIPMTLPGRTLLRHLTFGLPSGQDVARAMRADPLTPGELSDMQPFGFQHSTPLWFYVLREAEKRAAGEQLGPVGARIVAEVIIGLLEADQRSYLAQNPRWQPMFGERSGSFGIGDLLKFGGTI
jgi:hypothetical protein